MRRVTFRFSKERWRLNETQSCVLFRVVQECLSNSVRHGEAQNINGHLGYGVPLTLKDDGLGTEHIGLGPRPHGHEGASGRAGGAL
ncbi:hypothetical protein ABB02_00167 [Clostridiaceae bacterium JG1575]|nr:hypothetical protein ABB02_00167 [Clostridiaceae bacterium JG1575]